MLSATVSAQTIHRVRALTLENGEVEGARTLDDQPRFPEFRYIL